MDKSQLIQLISMKVGLSTSQSNAIVDDLLSAITDHVSCFPHAEVRVNGFGKFQNVPGHSSGIFDLSTGEQKSMPGPVAMMKFFPATDLEELGVSFQSDAGTQYIGLTNEKLE